MLLSALTMHTVAAGTYYNVNSNDLRLIAFITVGAGIQYLSVDPETAIRISTCFVLDFSITFEEIISIEASDDDSALTIDFTREFPRCIFAGSETAKSDHLHNRLGRAAKKAVNRVAARHVPRQCFEVT